MKPPLRNEDGTITYLGHTWKEERLIAFVRQTCASPFKGYVVGLGHSQVAGNILTVPQGSITLKKLRKELEEVLR